MVICPWARRTKLGHSDLLEKIEGKVQISIDIIGINRRGARYPVKTTYDLRERLPLEDR